jgi:FAD/FMN-containing dehydrogenase/Fe-S oxidoreductase
MSRTSLPLAEPVDVGALQAELLRLVKGEVRFDRLSRALYSTDASVYQIVPLGVVLPHCADDVAAVVEVCARHRVPLTGRGGGTSQAGQAIGAGVILDCSKHFNQVLEVNAAERWARVQPGCVLDDLNHQLKPFSLQFAPDISTASQATIGGMIANNSSGTHSIIHGKTGDHVLELTVVLADGTRCHFAPLNDGELEARSAAPGLEGDCYRAVRRLAREHADEIERRYPKILRRVGGYDLYRYVERPAAPPFNLAHILIGSEGTLAVTVEAKLRLVELPKAKALTVVHFHHLLDALAAAPAILEHRPAAVEVIDRYVLDATRLNAESSRLRSFLRGDPGAILIVELFGERPEELLPRLQALEADLARRGHGYHCHRAADAAEQARMWKLRKMALGLSMAEKGDAKALSFVEDTAVAPEHLRDYIAEFLALIEKHGTRAGVYAHASVGCLHVRPIVNLKTEEGVARFEALANEVADLVLKFGGALSGEHGDGLVRSPFQEKMFGPALYQAFRELKRTFDPLSILNPGKIVDAPPLATNLRYGPRYQTPEFQTTFDFSAEGGLTRAAELCAGVGDCRRKRDGSMCPSYQATREEQHSTRGRANALRLALTGQLGLDGLADRALHDALELCLECKACKAECPTNVDMARLKAEFLHQHQRRHGVPWRNRLIGGLDLMSRWGSRLAPLSNWLTRNGATRWLNEKLLGIDRRRLPPAFARARLRRLFKEQPVDGRDSVLLFPDTFADFYEPATGMAAAKLLGGFGFRTTLGPPGLRCCGRPAISSGLLDKAVALARHNVDTLYPWAAEGKPIVACEPSCLLTIKDDYPALFRGVEQKKASVVAGACKTLEEVLAARDAPAAKFRAGPAKILVQGHCHQRALVGMKPALSLLARVPGATVVDLDAGCCGMAGAFGYEVEHYEVSRLVGEQRLFPALRAAHAGMATIVAAGFSCRLQIQHFTGRQAVHPADLLASLLVG